MTNSERPGAIRKTGQPGYLQIADDLREQIRKGSLAPGDSLPSTAQLCAHYEVSASVVKAAISVLRTEGLVVGQQGKAVFVRELGQDTPASDTGDPVLIAQLGEIRTALRDLAGRIAQLEAAVFAEPPQTPRRGK